MTTPAPSRVGMCSIRTIDPGRFVPVGDGQNLGLSGVASRPPHHLASGVADSCDVATLSDLSQLGVLAMTDRLPISRRTALKLATAAGSMFSPRSGRAEVPKVFTAERKVGDKRLGELSVSLVQLTVLRSRLTRRSSSPNSQQTLAELLEQPRSFSRSA